MGATRSAIQRGVRDAHGLCDSFDLRSLVVTDAVSGGITDAPFIMGIGPSSVTPMIEVGLRRSY